MDFDNTCIDDPPCLLYVLHLKNFVTPCFQILVSFVNNHQFTPSSSSSSSTSCSSSSSYSSLSHWHKRASALWNWWRGACENVSGESLAKGRKGERECILGLTDSESGKSSFSWTLNCKMEDPLQTMAVINRLWWVVSRKYPMPARTRWKTEGWRERRRESEREMAKMGMEVRDINREDVCHC